MFCQADRWRVKTVEAVSLMAAAPQPEEAPTAAWAATQPHLAEAGRCRLTPG